MVLAECRRRADLVDGGGMNVDVEDRDRADCVLDASCCSRHTPR